MQLPKEVSGNRRTAAVDLLIVLAAFAIGSLSIPVLNPLLRHGRGLTGVLAAALYQLSLEGLVPAILISWRRERLGDFGLTSRNLGRSIALAVGLAIVYDILFSLHAGKVLWIPLARQPATKMSLALGMPTGLLGIAIVTFAWGAAEGFFGVYFARKFSLATRTRRHGWLAPGVLAFALFNGLVHLLVGQGLLGFVDSFASGYAIAVIPAVTQNAWGGLLVQMLTNALGSV